MQDLNLEVGDWVIIKQPYLEFGCIIRIEIPYKKNRKKDVLTIQLYKKPENMLRLNDSNKIYIERGAKDSFTGESMLWKI